MAVIRNHPCCAPDGGARNRFAPSPDCSVGRIKFSANVVWDDPFGPDEGTLNLLRRRCPEVVRDSVTAKPEFMSRQSHLAGKKKFSNR
jgi:hypothetical protein